MTAARVATQPHPRLSPATWLQTIRSWHYSGGKRDLRFDLLRGFAVFAMVVDHINGPRSIFYLITGGDLFFVSAAELFVFLSGLLMGMINGGLFHRGDVSLALSRVLNRAGMLYALTVGLTLVTAVVPLLLGFTWLSGPQDGSLLEYIVGILTLHRTANLVDVMLLYTILVLAAEPVLLLLQHGYMRLVLTASWSLWFVWQLWPTAADIWPIPGDELFTVASWQVLFMTALVIGFHRRKLEAYFRAASGPLALLIAGSAFAGAIALYFAHLAPLSALTGRDHDTLVEWFFAKDDVAPGRIVTFASFFVFAYALTTLAWQPLQRALGWLLLPLGQNALSAYVLQIFVLKLMEKLQHPLLGAAPKVLTTTLFQFAGVLLVWSGIRLRPLVASSLEQLESAWATFPAAASADAAITQPNAVSVDVQLAQAEGRRGIDMLR